ncbi:hypothetical protein PHMEG_00012136 [Phytophthora megakarya]|uniref:Uncharacterized protein n=1 Tax=Phytophthora megakarya TaxID=4795 RepID=A0A225WC31_9STRA|nr:hypothetical protein PHMEG_00012136 [Phytophthora megakarya]
MENMYRQDITPERLALKCGTTKAQFQEEYRQYYKWKESWKLQRAYALPGKHKIATQ